MSFIAATWISMLLTGGTILLTYRSAGVTSGLAFWSDGTVVAGGFGWFKA